MTHVFRLTEVREGRVAIVTRIVGDASTAVCVADDVLLAPPCSLLDVDAELSGNAR